MADLGESEDGVTEVAIGGAKDGITEMAGGDCS